MQINGLSLSSIDTNKNNLAETSELRNIPNIHTANLSEQTLNKLADNINSHFTETPNIPFNLVIDGAEIILSWGENKTIVNQVGTEEGAASGGALSSGGTLTIQEFSERIQVDFRQDENGYTTPNGGSLDNIYKFSLGVGRAGISSEAMFLADTTAEIKAICNTVGTGTGVELGYIKNTITKLANEEQLDRYEQLLLNKYQEAAAKLVMFLEQNSATEILLGETKVTAPFNQDNLLRTILNIHLTQMEQEVTDDKLNNGAFQIVLQITKSNPQRISIQQQEEPPNLAKPRYGILRALPRIPHQFGNSAKYSFKDVFPNLTAEQNISIDKPELLSSPYRVYEYNLAFEQEKPVLRITLTDTTSPIADTSNENRHIVTISGDGLVDYLAGMTKNQTDCLAAISNNEEPSFLTQAFTKYINVFLGNNLYQHLANTIDNRTVNQKTRNDLIIVLAHFLKETKTLAGLISPEFQREIMDTIIQSFNLAGTNPRTQTPSVHNDILRQALENLEKMH
ncbi:MAG: hypothetical protein LBD99_04200 [Candidatus Margulisbacteria bacterium]|jgi:hypothetical protein|nr:hypothetical protein [Candidatus Margulisiibacteriota bacterium]